MLLCTVVLQAQTRFSLATNLSLLRNFDNTHPYFAVGQTIQAQAHIGPKSTIYGWFGYYTHGKYNNELTATAKLPLTQPSSFSFTNHGDMRLRQVSFGYKRFLRGAFDKPNNLNIYFTAGFGLFIGTVINSFSTPVDTADYSVEKNLREGSGDFKRLTIDFGTGGEYNVANDIFLYSELRVSVPTTSYPYNLLLKNNITPLPATLNVGLRILF